MRCIPMGSFVGCRASRIDQGSEGYIIGGDRLGEVGIGEITAGFHVGDRRRGRIALDRCLSWADVGTTSASVIG
jgi:hypothetical protein